MSHFPILMYHRVHSAQHPAGDPVERPWAVTLDAFVRQLDRLGERGQVGVSMEQVHGRLQSGQSIPKEWVAITFDDGNRSDHAHALRLLADREYRATFFVCGHRVDAPGGLDRSMIREMAEAGMHIGSHAMTHRFLTTLSRGAEQDELSRSKELLERIVGVSVDHFAPPGGRWSKRTEGALRQLKYCAVSTSSFGYNDGATVKFAYRRIPVVDATTGAGFDAIVSGARLRLLPGYARAGAAGVARRLVGEARYARLRGYNE